MTLLLERRRFLLATATLPLVLTACVRHLEKPSARLAQLEAASGGRLGVYAIHTGNNVQIGYRAHERFPFCSTFKMLLAAAILAKSVQEPDLLQQRIYYRQSDLVTYSPISGKHLEDGMTIAELCAAAIQYSDNTAANLLIQELGEPAAVTAFARSIGNTEFRLDRWETELNTAIPNDERDTVTPVAMARSLQALALGNALPKLQQQQLNDWLLGNTTGAKRIRAGVPSGWQVGDKTGSGDYGTTNDIAVLWPPLGQPMVLAIYYTQTEATAKWRDEVVAEATRLVVAALTQSQS